MTISCALSWDIFKGVPLIFCLGTGLRWLRMLGSMIRLHPVENPHWNVGNLTLIPVHWVIQELLALVVFFMMEFWIRLVLLGQAGFISINEAQFLSILVGVCESCNLGLFFATSGWLCRFYWGGRWLVLVCWNWASARRDEEFFVWAYDVSFSIVFWATSSTTDAITKHGLWISDIAFN